jgi:hypothetical protein
VEDGINLRVIWFDEDMLEVLFSCSNRYFSGQAEIYLAHETASKLADTLRGSRPVQSILAISSLVLLTRNMRTAECGCVSTAWIRQAMRP